MNRVKFLVYAMVTAGVWAYHVLVSGAAVTETSERATSALMSAGTAVALRIEAQRSELEAALVQLSTSPAAWNLRAGGKDGASPERLLAVRQVLASVVSEAQRSKLVVALLLDQNAWWAAGEDEPGAPPAGFDVGAAAAGQSAGTMVTLGDVPYLFFATSLLGVDHNEVRPVGTVVAGLPILPDARRLEGVARELRLSTLAIASQGKILVAAGTERLQAEPALKALKAGQVAPLGTAPIRQLGPLQLPLFTAGATPVLGARHLLSGTPFEVVAVASARASFETLAAYQAFGILALLGLLVLAGVVAFLIHDDGDDGGPRVSLPAPPLPAPPSPKRDEGLAVPPPVGSTGHGPEASPEDFHFPPSAVSAVRAKDFLSASQAMPAARLPEAPPVSAPPAPLPAAAEAAPPLSSSPSDPFAIASPALPLASRPASSSLSGFAFPSTIAGPSLVAAADTQAMPASEAAPPVGEGEESPDATRVALVPQELIKASRQNATGGALVERQPARAPLEALPKVPAVMPTGDAEEKHYQDVFRDFVATRERCGEPAEGLTYERFKAKLLKNREQLLAKYQCRTVRFQVYVKEGKAALKASPVRD